MRLPFADGLRPNNLLSYDRVWKLLSKFPEALINEPRNLLPHP